MSRVVQIEAADNGHCDKPMMDCEKGRFKYTLSCGHVLNRANRRRWIGGSLTQPKTLKCPIASCPSRASTAQQGEGEKP